MSKLETKAPPAAEGSEPPTRLVEHFFRHEAGRLVSLLVKHFGPRHLELVEDMVQASLADALQAWRLKGIPDNPSGWVSTVARNKILDALRHKETVLRLAPSYARMKPQEINDEYWDNESGIEDAQLRMMFACCHPSLNRSDQIALTLKTLCGFGIQEIASALLQPEETIKKRLQRARQTLAEQPGLVQDIVREELPNRLAAVHQCLYLLFNEGYAASCGNDLLRRDVCEEAIRLARLLAKHPDSAQPSTLALLALMLFHAARFETRTDDEGRLLLLEEQDRTRWNKAQMAEAEACLDASSVGDAITVYHLQAGIAFEHCKAKNLAQTNWLLIHQLYDVLLHKDPSPVVALNRAVVVAKIHGPQAGLDALAPWKDHPAIQDYSYFHAARGELLRQAGDTTAAIQSFRQGLGLARTASEREFLQQRIHQTGT